MYIIGKKPEYSLFCLCFFFILGNMDINTNAQQYLQKQIQVNIWSKSSLNSSTVTGSEISTINNSLVTGKPFIEVKKVSKPTITIYPPKGKNTGVSVVVFPGGGYKILAIALEGTEVCDWLTSKGVTCVLLKYRVPFSGPYWDEKNLKHVSPKVPMALQDAQRTMGLLRFHSKDWNINPHKIGVLGFSAGGHLVADISTHFKKRLYSSIDSADNESCRPDFSIVLYPGHMLENTKKNFELNPNINVTKDTPPTFLLQAQDDPIDDVKNSLVYYIALKNAGVPTEMHLYAQGGHAFGLRATKFPITRWPELVEKWLLTIGITSK